MFSLTFKAFVMFVTFLLFQSNRYVVLAHGKVPKDSVHLDLFKPKNPDRVRFNLLKMICEFSIG